MADKLVELSRGVVISRCYGDCKTLVEANDVNGAVAEVWTSHTRGQSGSGRRGLGVVFSFEVVVFPRAARGILDGHRVAVVALRFESAKRSGAAVDERAQDTVLLSR